MMKVREDRRRTALWTIGRGSRSLLRFRTGNGSYVVAGTTAAKGRNTVHILHVDKDENTFRPVRVYATGAEAWSIELFTVKDHFVTVVALTRRKQRSSVELWSLSIDDSQNMHSAYASPGSSVDEPMLSIDTNCSIDLEGNAFKILRCRADSSQHLVLTSSTAAVLKVSESLDLNVTVCWKLDALFGNADGERAIVDGGWIKDTLVFVASHRAVVICDCETGSIQASLNPSDVIAKPVTKPDELWVPPFVSRTTSVCSGGEHMLYVGGQDGSLRAFEIMTAADLSDLLESERQQWISLDPAGFSGERKGIFSRMRWEAVKGHGQWVSVLYPLPNGGVLSGDIDGVVRCWAKDGSPSGTFPQHVDTITSATASAHSFLSISYDGRIALNQLPMMA